MAQSVKPADVGVTVGQVLQGKYRVESILGQGGMGVVVECVHLALNERVAIKMLRQDVLLDQDAVSRFIREAQAAVKLKSEYVARVSDVGTFDNGTPYMVMEYLEGHDLGDLIKQRQVLPAQWAVELMLQTAEALCEAHSLGIVHRDVKPSNLFVTWRPDGSALVKVLDFGISKSPMGTDMHLTQTQSLLGTPAYMSPEQMRSARLVDHRTDIWSLGTVFYEVLEGHKPFEAESFSEMCVKVAVDPPAPMTNTPPALQHVILRCLAKAHEQRYANMAELARDLVPFSVDPHNAQMLVERMSRMMKRSTYDWEGQSTGVGRQALPQSIKDYGSGPVRNTPVPSAWGGGSDPAARPWHSNTPSPFTADRSSPFAKPLPESGSDAYGLPGETIAEPRKRRSGLVIALLVVATLGAIAFGVMKATDDTATTSAGQAESAADPETSAETGSAADSIAPHVDTTASGSADVTAADGSGSAATATTPDTGNATDAADDKTADDKTADDKTADNKTAENKTADKDGADADDKSAGKSDGKTSGKTASKSGSSKSTKSGGSKSTKSGGSKSSGSSSKQDGRVQKAAGRGSASTTTAEEAKKPEPAAPRCDPFNAMHGCKK